MLIYNSAIMSDREGLRGLNYCDFYLPEFMQMCIRVKWSKKEFKLNLIYPTLINDIS